MILQSLVNYYDRRITDPDSEIAPLGLEKKDLKFIIEIDENGKFMNLIDLRGSDKKGKYYLLPRSEGRSGTNSWQTAFLLWDHLGYVLGCPKSDTEKEKLRAAQQKGTFIKKIKSLPDVIKNDTAVQDSRNFQMPSCNSKALLIVFGHI